MKKRMIMLFCTMSTVAMLFSGCGETTETIHSETPDSSYSLFKTSDVQKYFSFLETFDEAKYEIVDISMSQVNSVRYYLVTYRSIAE